jgi:DNA repair exonuclease SbcCD ATPase subunit
MHFRRCLVVPVALAAIFGASVYPRASVSEAAALSVEQVAAYHSTLEQAKQSRSIVIRLGDCLVNYLTDLQARSAESERALGEALRRQMTLKEQVSSTQAKLLVFEEEARVDAEKVQAQAGRFNQARAEQQQQADRLRVCQSVFFGDPLGVCKAGENAVKSLRWMNDAEADLRAEQERLRVAEEGLRQTHGQLQESRQQLDRAEQDFAANRMSISQIEDLISVTKKDSSTVNIKIQDYNILLGAFEQTLQEAAAVDPDDVRIRQVDRLSAEINTLSSGTPAFVAATELSMPEDVKQRCSR